MEHRLKIFISSPSDVRPERLIAERVVRRLGREFSYHLAIEPVMWEREPLVATQHFAEAIPSPRDSDVVVVILWSRLGVPLPAEKFSGAVTKRPVTGTEWEFEEAYASYRERKLPDLLFYRKQERVLASLDDDAALQQQMQQKRLVDDFVRRWFVSQDGGSFTAASHSFMSAAEFEEQLETHLRELIRRRVEALHVKGEAPAAGIRWTQPPFRGLLSFDFEHSPVFFGRTRARNELRELLARQAERGSAFVLVMGASGSGKSSLVKAGLLPDLMLPGMVGRVALCRYAVLRPSDAGEDLLTGLSGALLAPTALPELAGLHYDSATLAGLLREASGQAALPIRQGLAAAGKEARLTEQAEARLVLIIDQLEELFTREGLDEAGRERFVRALDALARSGLVWVIATMRSDFFDRLEQLPSLARLTAGEARYLVEPPEPAEIGQIIRQPAREAGLHFELDQKRGVALDETIREAASKDPGALPLLSFLLDQLWQHRTETGGLTFAAYEELGGLEGALGRRAEAVFRSLPEPVQAALPRVLRALVTVSGSGAEPTSRATPMSRFAAGSPERALVDALLAARLVIAEGAAGGARLRVAHEALLTHWERARQQVATDRGDLELRAQLERAAGEWRKAERKDQDSLLLVAGLPLERGRELLSRRREDLSEEAVAFAEQSIRHERAQRERRLRRAWMVAGVTGLLAVAAAGFGWWGFVNMKEAQLAETDAKVQKVAADEQRAEADKQRQEAVKERVAADERRAEAERQRRAAESNLDSALAADKTLVTDVVQRLRRSGRVPISELRRILGGVEGHYDELLQRAPDNLRLKQQRAEMLVALADTYRALGDSMTALNRASEAGETMEALLRAQPDNRDWRVGMALCQDQIGDALRDQGVIGGALDRYKAAFEIRRKLAETAPGDATLQRMISVSHTKIGDILRRQGRGAGALDEYQASLEIRKRLAAAEPGNHDYQRDLAFIYDRVGTALRERGDAKGALAAHRAALEIRERLTQAEPGNAEWKADLAASHDHIGDILRRQEPADALSEYRTSLSIFEGLAATDPENTELQGNLSVGHEKIGDMLLLQRDPAGALKEYNADLEITNRLAAKDPENAEWQSNLSFSHQKIGDALRDQRDFAGAAREYRIVLEIRTRLIKKAPDNVQWRRALFIAHDNLGDALMHQGQGAAGLGELRQALALAEGLASDQPEDPGRQRDLEFILRRLGEALLSQNDRPSARDAMRRALEIADRFAAKFPQDQVWQQEAASLRSRLSALQ